MYCKHCGKEIADDSLFCQHCGGRQSESTTNNLTDANTDTQRKEKVVEIPTIKANFSESTKWWICGFSLWVVLNLYWLFADADNKYCRAGREFLPFTDDIDKWCRVYDITEFIVYVFGLPLIVWGLVMLNKKLGSDSATQQESSRPNVRNDREDVNKALGI